MIRRLILALGASALAGGLAMLAAACLRVFALNATTIADASRWWLASDSESGLPSVASLLWPAVVLCAAGAGAIAAGWPSRSDSR